MSGAGWTPLRTHCTDWCRQSAAGRYGCWQDSSPPPHLRTAAYTQSAGGERAASSANQRSRRQNVIRPQSMADAGQDFYERNGQSGIQDMSAIGPEHNISLKKHDFYYYHNEFDPISLPMPKCLCNISNRHVQKFIGLREPLTGQKHLPFNVFSVLCHDLRTSKFVSDFGESSKQKAKRAKQKRSS